MNSNQILRERGLEIFLHEFEEKITAARSRLPDPQGPFQVSRRIGNARQAMSLIFISTFFSFWQTDKVIRAIGQKAYLMNYQGDWKKVQEILETQDLSPRRFIEVFLIDHSPEDFFGNLAKIAERELKVIRFRSDRETNPRKPKKGSRRRGYRDHGTLRLLHQKHGEPPIPTQPREDRRSLISHPLLTIKVEENCSCAFRATTTSSEGR